jgi:hypothetical protein
MSPLVISREIGSSKFEGRRTSARTSNLEPRTSPTARRLIILLALLVLAPVAAHACTVCWGSPDDPMVKSVNKGIWVLLGFIGFVQIGFIALFWSFWRRARELKRFRESLRVIEGGPGL